MVSKQVLELNYSRFYINSLLKNTITKGNLKAERIRQKLEEAKRERDEAGNMDGKNISF